MLGAPGGGPAATSPEFVGAEWLARTSPEGGLTMPDGTVHYNDSPKAEKQRATKREKMLRDLETAAKGPN